MALPHSFLSVLIFSKSALVFQLSGSPSRNLNIFPPSKFTKFTHWILLLIRVFPYIINRLFRRVHTLRVKIFTFLGLMQYPRLVHNDLRCEFVCQITMLLHLFLLFIQLFQQIIDSSILFVNDRILHLTIPLKVIAFSFESFNLHWHFLFLLLLLIFQIADFLWLLRHLFR